MTSFSLLGSTILDVSFLGSATKLEMHDLTGTKVSDLSPLVGLDRLRWLYLYDCPDTLDLSPLAALPRRIRIRLRRGQKVTGLDAVHGRHRISWL